MNLRTHNYVQAELAVFVTNCVDVARLNVPDLKESARCLGYFVRLGCD